MSLRKNIIASYLSQLYVALVGVLMLPIYVKFIGIEGFGLVGFFIMIQAWFQLLDIGMTPTLARSAARFRAGAIEVSDLRRLVRAVEGVFLGFGLVGLVLMIGAGDFVATRWLKPSSLSHLQVTGALTLIAFTVTLRWMCGVYRSLLTGLERIAWLSAFNAMVATARFVLVIPILILIDGTPVVFFGFQLGVAIIELAVLAFVTYSHLPRSSSPTPWEFAPLRDSLDFSLSIGFTSSVWIFVTQSDKLLLSKLLPLSEYAQFTLAVTVASSILLASSPITTALLPRMTGLHAQGRSAALVALYRKSTQFLGAVAIPVALVLGMFPREVIWAWTGDDDLAAHAGPILRLYAIGNGILVFSALPYYLQYAAGTLSLHLVGSALFVALLIPALLILTPSHGPIGAGYAWVAVNAMYLTIWVPFVHRKFLHGTHLKWAFHDIVGTILLAAGVSLAFRLLVSMPNDRLQVTLILLAVGCALTALSITSSYWGRELIKSYVKHP